MGRKVRKKGVYNSEVKREKKVAMWVLGGRMLWGWFRGEVGFWSSIKFFYYLSFVM
jgi:hypothetical protein